MLTELTQRWRPDAWKARRGVYVPAGTLIRPSDYEVVPARSFTPIKRFVEETHYSGSFPQCSRGFELRTREGALVGAAVFSVVARLYQPHFGAPLDWLTLARFVLLDSVPGNGESWFLARTFDLLRAEGFAGVVSYSDPVPRTDAHGRVVFPGHIGGIYQSTNGVYLGLPGKGQTKWLLPDGGLFESRAAHKVKAGDQGRDYAAALLVRAGATPLAADEDPTAWILRWRERLLRPLWHAGNHKYVWPLAKRDRRHLPPSLPYPKLDLSAAWTQFQVRAERMPASPRPGLASLAPLVRPLEAA